MTTQSGVDVVERLLNEAACRPKHRDGTTVVENLLREAAAEIIARRSRVAEAEGRVSVLRAALEFYAMSAWVTEEVGPDGEQMVVPSEALIEDIGAKARTALYYLTPSAGSEKEGVRALSASPEPHEWVEKVREALEEYACAGLGKCEMYGTSGRCMNDMCGQSCGDSALKALALLPHVGTREPSK